MFMYCSTTFTDVIIYSVVVCLPIGYYLNYWNVPFLPESCMDKSFDNNNHFQTLVRTKPSLPMVQEL